MPPDSLGKKPTQEPFLKNNLKVFAVGVHVYFAGNAISFFLLLSLIIQRRKLRELLFRTGKALVCVH